MGSSQIHSTALVDPSATLGEGTTVGPYCVVGEGVQLGKNCQLHHHVSLSGPSTFGDENNFHPFACIGGQSQDLKYQGEPTWLRVGSRNTFREFVTVNRATDQGDATEIGDDCHFLAYAHVGHDCQIGHHVIFSNNGTLAGHVVVEDHAILGGLSAVHQFCRIGRHAFIGGCAKVTQDVPPYMMADGNPARMRDINRVGLQRKGMSESQLKDLYRAFRTLYRSELNTSQALDRLAEHDQPLPEVVEIMTFVRESQRGITR
ncbi:MAG: acyl-ACP--UDP-N-acetylglucosamine O-acyltransferase [Verrucomicrobiota bacterium]